MDEVSEAISEVFFNYATKHGAGEVEKIKRSIKLIPSIESARGLWNAGEIAGWKSKQGDFGGVVGALLVSGQLLFKIRALTVFLSVSSVCSRRL